MRAFIRQLAGLCNRNRWQPKWVVVPSHAAGVLFGERLVRAGVSWANLRFVTPTDLAVRTVGASLAAQGIDVFDEQRGSALVLRLLLDLPADTPAYFRPLAEGPGMAEALWSTITDIRLAGCSSQDLTAAVFANPAKQAELRALLCDYERYLAENKLADRALLVSEATEAVQQSPVRPSDLMLEVPGACSSILERRFIDHLQVSLVPVQKLRTPGLDTPSRFVALCAPVDWVEPPTKGLNNAQRLRWLLQPATAPQPAKDSTLQMFRAAGPEAEVEEVFHRILSDRLALDTVEISCAQPDSYVGLIWEKCQRSGWPATLQMGLPGTYTRPLRALLAFCDWIGSGFSGERLVAMLQSGDLDPAFGEDVTATAAGRIVRRSGATLGRESYAGCLSALIAEEQLRAADPELDPDLQRLHARRAAQSQAVADWIGQLLAAIPVECSNATVQMGDLVRTCTEFCAHVCIRSREDAAARDAITEALGALQPLSDLQRPASFVLGLIKSRVRAVCICSELPRQGALHVSPLSAAGESARPAVFVLGLAERHVFPRGLEDPVLLDCERAAVAPETLASSTDRVAQAVHAILERLANLEGRVHLSFSCRDLRQAREVYPSWILLNTLLLLRPGADFSYRELNQFLDEPASVVPRDVGAALNDSEWWLASLRGTGSAAMEDVLAAFPGLERGTKAVAARNGGRFTAHDGWVRQAGSALDIRTEQRAVSASTLEAFAACPFRHLLRYGLGIEPIEIRESDSDTWLDAAERGQLLHDIYAQFLRLLRGEGRRPVKADAEELHRLANKSIEILRVRIPPPSEGVFARELAQINRDLEFFLAGELEMPNRTPVALEVTFGFLDDDNVEPLATFSPVPIDLGDGHKIWLRGRIDRIDQLADGTYEVIDYKTGRLNRKVYDGEFSGGRLLQHALYSRAARHLLRTLEPSPRIAMSTYYFVSERGAAQRVSFPGHLDVSPVLRDLADAIASGTFPLAASDDGCKWCQYGRACCGGVAQSPTKLASGEAAIAAYKRLIEHA